MNFDPNMGAREASKQSIIRNTDCLLNISVKNFSSAADVVGRVFAVDSS